MLLNQVLFEGHERAWWWHAQHLSLVHDRNSIFNDCFRLGICHTFLNSFALSSLESRLVFDQLLIAIHPALRGNNTVCRGTAEILYILQGVTKFTIHFAHGRPLSLWNTLSDVWLSIVPCVPHHMRLSSLIVWLKNGGYYRSFRLEWRGFLVYLFWIDRLLGKIRAIVSQFSSRYCVLKIALNRRCEPFSLMSLKLYLTRRWVDHVIGVDYVSRRRSVLFILSKQAFPLLLLVFYCGREANVAMCPCCRKSCVMFRWD